MVPGEENEDYIIGDGKLGYNLAENLFKENNDVIIDKNPEALKRQGNI